MLSKLVIVKMRCAFALLVAGLVIAAGHGVNYCGAKMCAHTNAHTLCQYYEGPSPKCVGYLEARLSVEEKARILARLNRRRSEAASGNLRNMPSAGNMLKLRWVEELAREAQRWADQCRPPSMPEERDACRDLYSITVGQCVASVVGEAPGLRVETMVDLWFMQSMHYKENITAYVEPRGKVNYYGDFAQMIWARSYMVGCGRSRFMSVWRGRPRTVERLVCNMSPRGPSAGRPLWSPAPPAAACPPRSIQDPQLPALCNFHADLDVTTDIDGAMTIEEHVLLSTVLEIENKESFNYLGSLDELYLTKLAIVTMENTITPPVYYNPMHKRDIVDTLALDLNLIDDNNINNMKFINTIHVTMGVNTEVSTVKPKIIYNKIKLIGRPKSYNLEELIDIGEHEQPTLQQINMLDTREQVFTKLDPDLYLDDIPIRSEVNLITTEDFSIFSETVLNEISPNEIITDSVSTRTTESKDIIINITEEVNEVMVINEYNSSTIVVNSSVFNSSMADDDYLSNPETSRELQEALEQMEHYLGEQRQMSGKVRRELRDLRPKNVENDNITNNTSNSREISEDIFKSKDRAPMLNMVLKYIPYLKPYKKEILGTTAGSSLIKLSHMVASTNVALILNSFFL